MKAIREAGQVSDTQKALNEWLEEAGNTLFDRGIEYGAQPTIVYGTVTDLLKRFRPVGWKHFVGYSVFRQEALRRIESASSIGTNS